MGLETGAIVAYASLAASLAGAGVSAYASHKQAQAEKDMGVYNAKVAAEAQRAEADTARANAQRQREENHRRLGMMKGGLVKAGVNIGGGSGLDVIAQSAGELEMQAMDVFRNSDSRIRQAGNQGAMSLWQGAQAGSAGNMETIGTLFGGLSQAGTMYGGFRNSGVIRTGYN